MQYSQEHLKTMVYAKFGGQTECIMGNSKIENYKVEVSSFDDCVKNYKIELKSWMLIFVKSNVTLSSWMLWSTLIFGGDAGWNSIVRYLAWWLKRRPIYCVTDSWTLGGKLADTLLTPSWHTIGTRVKHETEFPALVCLCSEFPSSIRKDSFLEERLWEQFRGLHLVVSCSSHCCWFTLHRDLMYTATQLLLKLMRPS